MLIEMSHMGIECPLRRKAKFGLLPVQDLSLEVLLHIASPFKGHITINLYMLRSFEAVEPRASIS